MSFPLGAPNQLQRDAWIARRLRHHFAAAGAKPTYASLETVEISADTTSSATNPLKQLKHWRALPLRTAEWRVGCLAAALSIGAYSWYASRGLTMAYTDAVSHMMIARRVVDGRASGIAQLGTVWLPLHHLLMLPLIWVTPLFRDGFAGVFPSMVAYILASVYLYRTGLFLFSSRLAGSVAALAFMLNPSMLYMQATAMTESEMLCVAVLAVYYLLRWSHWYHLRNRPQAVIDLAKASIAIVAGTLIRYDAWFLAIAAAVLVLYVTWRKQGRMVAEAWMVLFAGLAFAGCAAWFLYNWLIFRDPFAFYHNEYSALAQQRQFQAVSGLPTHQNLLLSIRVYAQVTIDTVGWPLATLMLVGVACWLFRDRLRAQNLPVYLMFAPFAFNVLSLFVGASVIETPEFSLGGATTYFNERYGMMMLPACAIFLAFLAIQRRALLALVLGVIVVFGIGYSFVQTPYALDDPLFGAVAHSRTQSYEEGQWLAAQYHGGHILISYAPDAPAMFYSNLPESVFVTDADRAAFQAAVAQPYSTVSWIVMSPDAGNPVWAALKRRTSWRSHFVLCGTFGATQIYERVGSGPTVVEVNGRR